MPQLTLLQSVMGLSMSLSNPNPQSGRFSVLPSKPLLRPEKLGSQVKVAVTLLGQKTLMGCGTQDQANDP